MSKLPEKYQRDSDSLIDISRHINQGLDEAILKRTEEDELIISFENAKQKIVKQEH